MEKQFKLTFEKAKNQPGNTGDNFIKLLESRFDNVIYRLGIASSRVQARQMVGHGQMMINNHNVNIPSYLVKTGDIIKVKSSKCKLKIFKDMAEKLKKKEIPGWLNFDANEMAAKVLHQPDISVMKPNFNIQMIIEFYSK
jgi:small subunit ribosomal protein S4